MIGLDGSETPTDLPAEDVLFLTEYGSITLPARPILTAIINELDQDLTLFLDKVVDEVFEHAEIAATLDTRLIAFCDTFNQKIPSIIDQYQKEVTFMSEHSRFSDQNQYVVPLSVFSGKIICKLFKI